MRLLLVTLCLVFYSRADAVCSANQYVVRAHPQDGYIRQDGTVVRPTFVKEYCKDFSAGYLFAKDLVKDKAPSDWPHKETSKSWKEAEKERLIEALEDVPEILLSKNLKGIFRMVKSKDFPNPATSAAKPGWLALYDTAFTGRIPLERILSHELSHQNFEDLDENEQQNYREAAGWYKDFKRGKYDWSGRKSGYVAEDGRTSYEEDYANNIEYYLYEPDKLKLRTPGAYEWLKKHFGEKLSLKKRKK